MSFFEKVKWFTGSKEFINFSEILKISKESVYKNSKIFIGTDSFVSSEKVTFASAICLHGNNISRYFFCRQKENYIKYGNLSVRITEEVRRSVEIAEFLMDSHDFDPKNIELHLDISPLHLNNGTSKFSEMLKGYVMGYGLECKIKPNAWASQSVADRHSK